MPKTLYLLLFLTCMFITSSYADVYQWTDPQGNIHYSDTPHPGATTVTINPPAPPNNSQEVKDSENLIQAQEQAQQQTQKQQAEQAQAQKAKTVEQQTKEFCDATYQNVQLLQETSRRVYEVLPDGTYHYFDDQERLTKLGQLQKQMKEFCPNYKPPASN